MRWRTEARGTWCGCAGERRSVRFSHFTGVGCVSPATVSNYASSRCHAWPRRLALARTVPRRAIPETDHIEGRCENGIWVAPRDLDVASRYDHPPAVIVQLTRPSRRSEIGPADFDFIAHRGFLREGATMCGLTFLKRRPARATARRKTNRKRDLLFKRAAPNFKGRCSIRYLGRVRRLSTPLLTLPKPIPN